MRTLVTNQTPMQVEHINFGRRDNKNRAIGCCIRTYECDFIEAPPDKTIVYTKEPGHYYALICHHTRDRMYYGASQHTRYFRTLAEREIAIKVYLAGAYRRYNAERRST